MQQKPQNVFRPKNSHEKMAIHWIFKKKVRKVTPWRSREPWGSWSSSVELALDSSVFEFSVVGVGVETDEAEGRFTRASRHFEFLSMSQLQPGKYIWQKLKRIEIGGWKTGYLSVQHTHDMYEKLDTHPWARDSLQYLHNLPAYLYSDVQESLRAMAKPKQIGNENINTKKDILIIFYFNVASKESFFIEKIVAWCANHGEVSVYFNTFCYVFILW